MAKKGQKFLKYSLDERLKIVSEYNSNKYSSSELSKKYGISDNTIRMWAYQLKKGNSL